MAIINGREEWLNGRTYAPVKEFSSRPEGGLLITACHRGKKVFEVYTTEEHVGTVLDMLIRQSTYSPMTVDSEKTNI